MDLIVFIGLLVCAIVSLVVFFFKEKKRVNYCEASLKQMAERASYDYHQLQRAKFAHDRLASRDSWVKLFQAEIEHNYSQYLLRESMNRYRSTPLILR
jgi:hypothetical protein